MFEPDTLEWLQAAPNPPATLISDLDEIADHNEAYRTNCQGD